MTKKIIQNYQKIAQEDRPIFSNTELRDIIKSYLDKKDFYLEKTKKALPCYFFEPRILRERAALFKRAFSSRLQETGFYFAMKCNNHPAIVKTVSDCGFGIDVSSGIELDIALSEGASDIVFSGPGKRDNEIFKAIENTDKVRILIDSFTELERVSIIAKNQKKHIRVGVRLTTNPNALWRKFGIPLEKLNDFINESKMSEFINFEGLQFHTSWNMTPLAQCEFIEKIGKELQNLSKENLNLIKFVDIGGGYWPEYGEWLHYETTSLGLVEKTLGIEDKENKKSHYRFQAKNIDCFAEEISKTIKEHIFDKINCRICFEPGRWICNDSIQILLTVLDIKEPDIAIVDAGINAIGWDRFEYDYSPVINLTRPSLNEQSFNILGSLCTPHDVWGYSYFGKAIKVGDILMVPMQGAYTYSLRQNFIKPIPDFIISKENGEY